MRKADSHRPKPLEANASEREGGPIQTEVNMELPSRRVEQGDRDNPIQGSSLTVPLKAASQSECESKQSQTPVVVKPNTTEEETTCEALEKQTNSEVLEQGHLDPVLSEDTTMTHSSTSTATIETTELSDGGTLSPHTDVTGRPSAGSGENTKTQCGEQLATDTQVGQGCSDPAFCQDEPTTGSTAFATAQTAQELHSENQKSCAAIKPNVSDNTSEKTDSEAIREQTYSKADQGSSNTAVSQGASVDGRTASLRAPNKPSTSIP